MNHGSSETSAYCFASCVLYAMTSSEGPRHHLCVVTELSDEKDITWNDDLIDAMYSRWMAVWMNFIIVIYGIFQSKSEKFSAVPRERLGENKELNSRRNRPKWYRRLSCIFSSDFLYSKRISQSEVTVRLWVGLGFFCGIFPGNSRFFRATFLENSRCREFS